MVRSGKARILCNNSNLVRASLGMVRFGEARIQNELL